MRNNLLLLSAVALSISTAIADENILLENNGFVVFEAETIAARGDWLSTNRISGHTGTGYYLWTGETALNVKKAGRDTLVYNFRITDPGNYELRWRSRIAQGNNRTEHNDSWVRFATGNNVQGEQGLNGWTKAYQNKLNVWSWQTSTVDNVGKPIRQFFAAGDHTIEISGRSNGHAIDRIVLFKYDDHEFDDESFTNAALSAITTGPVTLAEVSQPAEPAVVTPEPLVAEAQPAVGESGTSVSVAETIENKNLTDNNCSDGSITLTPVADVYSQAGNVINNNNLRIENGNRTAYLKFDASQVPDDFSSVALQFSIGTDNGDGTLAIHAGDHSNWTDQTDEAALLPSASVQLATDNRSWNSNSQYTIPLDSGLVTNDQISLLLNQLDGSSDFSLNSSNQSNGVPKLIFKGASENFCTTYASNLATTDPQTGTSPPATSNLLPEPSLQAALNETQSGGGSLSWSLIWLFLLPDFVRRAIGDRPVSKD